MPTCLNCKISFNSQFFQECPMCSQSEKTMLMSFIESLSDSELLKVCSEAVHAYKKEKSLHFWETPEGEATAIPFQEYCEELNYEIDARIAKYGEI